MTFSDFSFAVKRHNFERDGPVHDLIVPKAVIMKIHFVIDLRLWARPPKLFVVLAESHGLDTLGNTKHLDSFRGLGDVFQP